MTAEELVAKVPSPRIEVTIIERRVQGDSVLAAKSQAFLSQQPVSTSTGDGDPEAASGERFDFEPGDRRLIASCAGGRDSDVDAAVGGGATAFPGLADPPPDPAAELLWNLGTRIAELADELAQLEALDNGKPIGEALVADLPLSIDCYRYYAGWADKIEGQDDPRRTALPLLLHAARAGRRRRRDHPLELPAADAGVEVGPGARRRLHRSSSSPPSRRR